MRPLPAILFAAGAVLVLLGNVFLGLVAIAVGVVVHAKAKPTARNRIPATTEPRREKPADADVRADDEPRRVRVDESGEVYLGDDSPSNRFTVRSRDNFDKPGYVALYANGRKVWRKSLVRPNNAKVNDNGSVIVEDWLRNGELESTFYIFDSTGKPLLKRKYSANALESGFLTPDVAWLATASSRTDDSRIIDFFRVSTGQRLFRTESLHIMPKSGSEGDETLTVLSDRGLTYRYTFDGQLLNQQEVIESVEADLIREGAPWSVLEGISRRLERVGPSESLLAPLQNAVGMPAADEKLKARIYRKIGEIQLALERRAEALDSFDRALSLDARVGIKRTRDKLAKEIAS